MSLVRLAARRLRSAAFGALAYFRTSQNTFLLILSVIVGLVGGLGAVGFRMLIDGIQIFTVGAPGTTILDNLRDMPWYYLLLLPAVGGAVVGPLVHYFAKEAKGHGVPEVMEAVALHGGRIRPRLVLVKSFASAVTMATGGSVGREGPIVHVGSAIGSAVAQFLRLPPDRVRVLVGCGAAAGIAATFNAPVAGVLFAIELILGTYAITTLTPLIISSVMATVVCYAFPSVTGGNIRAFEIPVQYELVSAWEIPLYGVFGAVAAVAAVAFVALTYAAEDGFAKIPIPEPLKPVLGGFLLGALYLGIREITGEVHCFGIGYQSVEMTMRGELAWHVLLALLAFKLIATPLTIGSGGSGGIFAPSLFIGAMTGGVFGVAAQALFPGSVGPVGAYALVGMAAVVAGTTHAPIMAILMLFELTGDYKIILPLMISCVIASLLASHLNRDSIYTLKLSRRGVNLSKGLEVTIMESTAVEDVMHAEVPTVMETDDFARVLERLLEGHFAQLYVVNEEGLLKGVVRLNEVKAVINEAGLESVLVAADLMDTKFPRITPSSSIADCMASFGTSYFEELPVVEEPDEDDPDSCCKPVGLVTRRDLLLLYHHEVLRKGTLGLKYVRRHEEGARSDYVEMPKGHAVDAVAVSAKMSGKTLRQLDLRNRFKVNVVAIRSHRYELEQGPSDEDVPDPSRPLRRTDTLIVTGTPEDIEQMRKAL